MLSLAQARAHFREVRATTTRLAEPLSEADAQLQSMPEASPTKWHLAHTTWFFETFLLRSHLQVPPFDEAFESIFNSYYNGVGAPYPRPKRGLLSRPSLATVLAYRAAIDDGVEAMLDRDTPHEILRLLEIGIHHEQQHQELLLTDIKHALAQNPIFPAYQLGSQLQPIEINAHEWRLVDGGEPLLGADETQFCFDNETPRHRRTVETFWLGSRLITSGEYLNFINDRGYERHELWLSAGWDFIRKHEIRAPLYWRETQDGWKHFTLTGEQPLHQQSPVCHVSYYEADAFARWYGARLPTEFEWELAAGQQPVAGNLLATNVPAPRPAEKQQEISQLFGDCWEWTASAYLPYPRFRPWSGAVGEYNGKFMCDQMVLRGGSCATPTSHIRASYRNFFPSNARWQFSGIRLAKDDD